MAKTFARAGVTNELLIIKHADHGLSTAECRSKLSTSLEKFLGAQIGGT